MFAANDWAAHVAFQVELVRGSREAVAEGQAEAKPAIVAGTRWGSVRAIRSPLNVEAAGRCRQVKARHLPRPSETHRSILQLFSDGLEQRERKGQLAEERLVVRYE